jgi:orotidine-5'-phosphate decarboxylase
VAEVKTQATPIVALDVRDAASALAVVDQLADLCRFYKIGSELYSAEGPSVVRAVQERGASVFLDLKYHDIPNTVQGAVRSSAALGVRIMTVHASGGRAMLEAAARAAGGVEIFAVTVLTSFDAASLGAAWGREVGDMRAEVLRLAEIALNAGISGVVCSGEEAGAIRDAFGGRLATLVPGIRLAGGDTQDQARVVTPRQAAEGGAKYLVLGRAVTGAKSPRDAMSAVLADLS